MALRLRTGRGSFSRGGQGPTLNWIDSAWPHVVFSFPTSKEGRPFRHAMYESHRLRCLGEIWVSRPLMDDELHQYALDVGSEVT